MRQATIIFSPKLLIELSVTTIWTNNPRWCVEREATLTVFLNNIVKLLIGDRSIGADFTTLICFFWPYNDIPHVVCFLKVKVKQ